MPRGPRQGSGARHVIGHDPAHRPQPGRDFAGRPEFEPNVAYQPEFGPDVPYQPEFARDSIRLLRASPQPEPGHGASVRAAGSGVLDIMRKRNWVVGLAAPILAAIAVGIAAVVVTGGGGTGGGAVGTGRWLPARAAGRSELHRERGDVAGDPHRDRRVRRDRGGGRRRERRTGAVDLGERRHRLDPRGAARACGADPGGQRAVRGGRARSGRLAGGRHHPRRGRRGAGGLLDRRAHMDRDGRYRGARRGDSGSGGGGARRVRDRRSPRHRRHWHGRRRRLVRAWPDWLAPGHDHRRPVATAR